MRHRALWTSVLVGVVIAGASLANNVTLPFVFQANTPARAAEVNANFTAVKSSVDDNFTQITALQSRIAALEGQLSAKRVFTNATTGKRYSLEATFCGASAPTTGQIVDGSATGNVAAKSICERTCANSTSAHMCTLQEVSRFLATGGSFPGTGNTRGWYSNGVWSYDGIRYLTDCGGWTSNSATLMGPVSYELDSAHDDFCNNPWPILCCD